VTLEQLYFLASIVAAFGVVVSLMFVGLQIRRNTSANNAAAAAAVHNNFAAFYRSIQGDQALMGIIIKGLKDYDSISEVEKAQMNSVFMAFNLHMQDAFYKWKDGALSPEFWRAWELVSLNMFAAHGGKGFWADRCYLFSAAYQDFISNDLMQRPLQDNIKPFGAFTIGE